MSEIVKTHGLDGTLVEPDWAPLAMEEVRELLKQFPGRGDFLEIVSVSPRPFSAAAVIAAEDGRVFIKRHHRSVRDRDGLLEEHGFLKHLHAQGAAVPVVIGSEWGETAIEIGAWTYEVHEAPASVDIYGDAPSWTPFHTAAHARSAGAALARLHGAAEGFNAPRRKPRPLVASFTIWAAEDPEQELWRYLEGRPALADDAVVREQCGGALDLLAPFHAELKLLLPALTPLWTHNDLHASNLLWSEEGENAQAAAIIDFGLADKTNAVHDLAHAIERNVVEWLALGEDQTNPENVPVHFDHLLALLDGYESVRPLSNEERSALAPMVAICHAEFALSEADYFRGVLQSEEKVQLATLGYLVGHARWFRCAGGEKLLNALRRWAGERNAMKRER